MGRAKRKKKNKIKKTKCKLGGGPRKREKTQD